MKKHKSTRQLGQLKLVYPLYPRAKVDAQHVASIRDAMRAGHELPPIVIDEQDRVVDGFHRVTGGRLELGDKAKVPVEVRKYANDAEFFLDAVRLNADHGRMLSPFDRAHIAIAAEGLKIEGVVLAEVMHIRLEQLETLKINKMASVRIGGNGKGQRRAVPLKRTIRHMAGQELSPQQQEVNVKLGGMNQLFYVNQLIMLLEHDLWERDNEELQAALRRLAGLIETAIAVPA